MIDILSAVPITHSNGQVFNLNRVRLTSDLWLDEYIPFDLYRRYVTKGDKYYGWGDAYLNLLVRKLNPALIEADQQLRDQFGRVTINNWWRGGQYNYRGLRTCGCNVGTELSDHYQGMASDSTYADFDAHEVRQFIIKRWRILGITIIEADISWVHKSVAWIPGQKEIKIVNP